MTTPKQIAYKLARFARKHPETGLTVFEIPQVPGYRRHSRAIKGIDESFVTTFYAVPIVMANPYLAVGLSVDYLVRGRYRLIPKHPEVLGPENLSSLTVASAALENSASTESVADGLLSAAPGVDRPAPAAPIAGAKAPAADRVSLAASQADTSAAPGLKGADAKDE